MLKGGFIQRPANSAHPAVHHVRRRDDVRAGLGLNERLVDKNRARHVVEHVTALVDDSVMTMGRIGIERDVGEHADLGRRVLQRLDRPADQVAWIERLARILRAKRRRRVRKQRDAGNAELPRLFGPLPDPVHAPARDARQRGDRLLDAGAFGDEQRPDQVGRGQHSLGEQRPAPGGRARAAHADCGKGGAAHLARGLSARHCT